LAAESSLSRSEFEVRGSDPSVVEKVRFDRNGDGDSVVDADTVARFTSTPDFEPI
jgi:hypothetical protein